MRHFSMSVAGITFDVEHRYDFVRSQCEAYVVSPEDKPELVACTTDKDIAAETTREGQSVSVEVAESLCLFRSMAEQFPRYGRALFHGAAIEFGGDAYLFTAPSGTGKSTHIRLWRQTIGKDVNIINGDKPILRLTDNGVEVCSTPWAGKENWQRNVSRPLRAICLLERGETDSIRRVNPSEVLDRLLRQVYMPKEAQAAASTLELLDRLLDTVPVWLLTCTPTEHAARVAFDALTK